MRHDRARLLEDRGQLGLGFSVEQMTRVPRTDWVTPDLSSLPDRLAGVVGVDTETDDNGLRSGQGPGWAWAGGGRVVGYSVAADNCRVYLPIDHAEGNVDPDRARRWLNHVLDDESQTKVFANAMYDLGWAETDGVVIRGPVVDVQIAEPLLDEHRLSYELDKIALDRVGRGKDEDGLLEAGRCYGLGTTIKAVKARIAELPARHVGPYAEEDAQLPREVWAAQSPLIEEEGLAGVCDLEHRLIPMYMDMRRRGVRIDVDRVVSMRDRLVGEVNEIVVQVHRDTGIDLMRTGDSPAVWEPSAVAGVLDELGVAYPKTLVNKEPQITNELLQVAGESGFHVCKMLLEARQKDKLRGTFLEGQLLGQIHGGRVHGQVNPLKGGNEEKKVGTVTGRLSMSNPNLMFIPVRTEEGRMIRECFLPEDGEVWASMDHSQQEPRLLVHFAVLSKIKSAYEARDHYIADPGMNYHKFVATLTGLNYDSSKILNLAIVYGRGVKETAAELDITIDEAKKLFVQHEQKMPFAKEMSRRTQQVVQSRGYLRSLMGRRSRFPFFEPSDWDARDGRMLSLEKAQLAWPNQRLTRARAHKSLNSLIQPSAATQTKLGMLDVFNAGLGGHVLVQIHDELACSVPDRSTADQIALTMKDAVRLEVPSKVAVKVGKNWGKVQ